MFKISENYLDMLTLILGSILLGIVIIVGNFENILYLEVGLVLGGLFYGMSFDKNLEKK